MLETMSMGFGSYIGILARCAELGKGWRLPTITELKEIRPNKGLYISSTPGGYLENWIYSGYQMKSYKNGSVVNQSYDWLVVRETGE